VKESAGSIDQVSQIIHAAGPDFIVLSGDDLMTLPMMAVGAKGVISVVTNLIPARFAELVRNAAAGDFAAARVIHYQALPLIGALFAETNPIPVKAAMAMLGKCGEEVRLPLTPITDGVRARLNEAMKAAGLLG
jgi:4-hydroxy-tetrahydrodipicolinate synthase